MGHVEFDAKQRGRSLNVTYTDLADRDVVGFEVFTPDGELGIELSGRTVEELHDSLGAWLELRKKRRETERAAKKQARAEGQARARPSRGSDQG